MNDFLTDENQPENQDQTTEQQDTIPEETTGESDGAPDLEPVVEEEQQETKQDQEPEPKPDQPFQKQDYTPEQQQHIDKLIRRAQAKSEVKASRYQEEVARIQQERDQLASYIEEDTKRQERLKAAMDEDALVPEDIKALSDRPAPPASNTSEAARVFKQISSTELNIEGTELTIKMQDEFGDAGPLHARRIGAFIDANQLPQDIVPIANALDNGTKLIKAIAKDEDVRNQVQLAMYQSQSYDDFELKIRDVASKLSAPNVPAARKPKPEPSEDLKPKPSKSNDNEPDVVVIA